MFEGDQMLRGFEGCRGVGRGVKGSSGRGYVEHLDICSVEPDVEGSRVDVEGSHEPTIGAIGAHYRMLRDHAKVTMSEVEHNHTQMYVAATKELLNHWTASTSLTFGRRRRCRSDCVDADK